MDEFIGLDVEVIKSTRRELVGTKGRIVDETLNSFVIELGTKEKRIPKAQCVFRFHTDKGPVDIDGKQLVCRPEDRIKKNWRTFAKRK